MKIFILLMCLGLGFGAAADCEKLLNPWRIDRTVAAKTLAALDDYWGGQFAKIRRIKFEPAKLVLTEKSRELTGGCRRWWQGRTPAYYCAVDKTIYLAEEFFDYFSDSFDPDLAITAILAHEYGHHIQNLVGATAAKLTPGLRDVRTARKVLEYLKETHADMSAGTFAVELFQKGVISQAEFERMGDFFHEIGQFKQAEGAGKSLSHGTNELRREHYFDGARNPGLLATLVAIDAKYLEGTSAEVRKAFNPEQWLYPQLRP